MSAFALTIFTGAFLLFQVQPLIGKYILPWFGGSPAVWTTCLLFFQVFLLGGYAYAHCLARWFKPRVQTVTHLALVAAALAFLPITPDGDWKAVGAEDPTWRILALLVVSIGAPYFVLSATGPLMQHWFALARPGVSPYRLYALSNAGSLLALLSYPFLFEPLFTRQTQAALWSGGLGLYALFALASAVPLWRPKGRMAPDSVDSSSEAGTPPSPTGGTKLLWLLLPACGSVLLLSTTNKMCQDVAVVPFLWVLPLALYLVSFIVCFENPRGYHRRFFGLALIPSLALLCYSLFEGRMPLLPQILIYCWTLFNACMVCHGEVYRLRPHPRHLTGFYLMIAAGGAMGGVFVALAAPAIFNDYLELHAGLLLLVVLLGIVHGRERDHVTIWNRRWPLWRCTAAGGVVLMLVLGAQVQHRTRFKVDLQRNFYGVLKVSDQYPDDPARHGLILTCGGTLHGIQLAHPALERIPTSYYHERTGVGVALRQFPRQQNRRIGVVGLGVGTLAAWGRAGDVMRFYEINPVVRQFAEETFTYLRHSTAHVEIVMGDARLSLEQEAPQEYDVLVLDAFSSDAIPTHLLTRESFEEYLRHLRPDGVMAVHISNRHVDLAPVMENLAAALGLEAALISRPKSGREWWMLPSQWYLLTRNKEFLAQPEVRMAMSERRKDRRPTMLWTDDYASLYPLLR